MKAATRWGNERSCLCSRPWRRSERENPYRQSRRRKPFVLAVPDNASSRCDHKTAMSRTGKRVGGFTEVFCRAGRRRRTSPYPLLRRTTLTDFAACWKPASKNGEDWPGVTWNSPQDYSSVTVAPYTSAMGARAMDIQDAEEIIRAEYMEMPGLRLTFWQAQRLWNLSEERCERALNTLVATGFLVQNGDACYTRPASPTTASTRRRGRSRRNHGRAM